MPNIRFRPASLRALTTKSRSLNGLDMALGMTTISSCWSSLFLYPPEIREEPVFLPTSIPVDDGMLPVLFYPWRTSLWWLVCWSLSSYHMGSLFSSSCVTYVLYLNNLFLFGIGRVPVSALSERDRPVSSRLLLTLHGRPSSPAHHPVMGAPLFFPLIVGAQCCANHTHLCKHLGKVDLVEAAPFLQPERHRSGRHVAGIWTQGLRHRPRQHLKERIILP